MNTSQRDTYVDSAVTWIVAVVCICIFLQTVLLIVLALSIAFGNARGAETDRAFIALTADLVSLKWPLVLFAIVVVVRLPFTSILNEIVARWFSKRPTRAEATAESIHWSIEGTTKDLTALISSAYDQYERPMTEEMRQKLERFLTKAVENGETESIRDLRILWLHRMQHHDRAEAETLRRCDAMVEFVDSLERACTRLASGKRYDVVISHMGDDADGFELFKSLNLDQRERFIIYTRKAEDKVFIEEAEKLGIKHYTNWPWELFELVLKAGKSVPLVARVPSIKSASAEENGHAVAAGSSSAEVR